jgi:hypothetical protein
MSITSENYWGREIVTDALNGFFRRCCAHFKSNPLGGGTKGNVAHTTGRHRSREWVLHSRFCTDRSYGTVDKRDRDGNPRYIRACDVKLTPTQMREVSRRLDKAVRAGDLPQVAEWFGTFNNKTVVGWFEGHESSSDRSHLEHVHVGVWTKYAGDVDALDEIFAVMTGEDMELSDAAIQKIADKTVETLLKKNLPIPQIWKDAFPDDPSIQDGEIGYDTCVRSGYFHARQANDQTKAPADPPVADPPPAG